MKIKNIIRIIIVCSLANLASCTNLVNTETDSIPRPSAGNWVPGDPAALLETLYKDLNGLVTLDNVLSLGEHPTAEFISPTRGVDWSDNGVWRAMEQHTWDGTIRMIRDSWNILNQSVYKATEIIASNPTPSQLAEAKFLRAFFMTGVMDLFGQVPFREVTQGVDDLPKVFTRPEAFNFIVNELNEALPNLEIAGPKYNNGKASKAAAHFLLAKLYLNKAVFTSKNPEGPYTFDKADMDKVVTYVEAMAADGYSLDPDFFNAFSKTSNKETIFVSNHGSPWLMWAITLHINQDPSGWSGPCTLGSFYDKFEKCDSRLGKSGKSDGTLYSGIGLGFLIGPQYDDKGVQITDSRSGLPLTFTKEVPIVGAKLNQGIRVIKYHPANAGKYTFMRYGEAVLMKAEALLRSEKKADALATVNNLRSIRKASLLTELSADELFDEFGREIYWEGWKRTIEVRFEKFTTGEGVTNKEPHTVLYPIPTTAVVSNPNLKQNKGYQQ